MVSTRRTGRGPGQPDPVPFYLKNDYRALWQTDGTAVLVKSLPPADNG